VIVRQCELASLLSCAHQSVQKWKTEVLVIHELFGSRTKIYTGTDGFTTQTKPLLPAIPSRHRGPLVSCVLGGLPSRFQASVPGFHFSFPVGCSRPSASPLPADGSRPSASFILADLMHTNATIGRLSRVSVIQTIILWLVRCRGCFPRGREPSETELVISCRIVHSAVSCFSELATLSR